MTPTEKRNQNFMRLVRTVHDLAITDDIEKNRIAQMNMGIILGTKSREAVYEELMIGNIPAEIVRPNRPRGRRRVILYCHGGGYITGSLLYARLLTTKLALAASMDVISFDYRLAPEYPYPAALDDAVAVWDYLMLKGYASRDVIVAGDSAGGNLALALGLKLKESGRFLPGCFACMSPWTDLACTGETYETKAEVDPILDREYVDRARNAYCPDLFFANPLVSPLYGIYTGFPPVYIQAGRNEILLSDSAELQKRMKKQGVDVKLDIYTNMWHVFQMSNFKTANDAVNRIAAYILERTEYN